MYTVYTDSIRILCNYLAGAGLTAYHTAWARHSSAPVQLVVEAVATDLECLDLVGGLVCQGRQDGGGWEAEGTPGFQNYVEVDKFSNISSC